MTKLPYILSAISGVLLTLVLMLLPSIVLGVPHLALSDRRYQTFLMIISILVMLEATGANQVHFQSLQSRAKWLPYLMSITLMLVFLSSLTERTLTGISPFTISASIGVIVMSAGILLRYLAIRTLGVYFLDDVAVVPGQPLVMTGIYSRMRHPSETGNLCIAFGSPLLLGSLIGLIIATYFLLPIVLIRIKFEDHLLMDHYPELFRDYARNVPALLPRWNTKCNTYSITE